MVIHVRQAKGRKDRYVMLSEQLLGILREYWERKRPSALGCSPASTNRPMTARSVQRAFRDAADAPVSIRRSPCTRLRHSFATHLLEQGVDIRVIQDLLGHRNINSTTRYARVAINTIRQIQSPLEALKMGRFTAGLIGRHVPSEAGGGGCLPPLRRGMACRQRGHVSLAQRRVMTAIEICRTAALGGHVERCEDCAHTRIAYNSCRNRHCPKCQWRAAEAWLEAREAELLPVPYFHVVFTLPATIGAIAYQNKAKVYGLLFTAAAETLTTIAADPKHLGADIGVTAVLHTWGQNLDHHPHVHCIVPGGGISPDGKLGFVPARLLPSGTRALAPVPALVPARSRSPARRRRAAILRRAGRLRTRPPSGRISRRCDGRMGRLCQAALCRARQVLAYLARYTHRVAIANSRLIELGDDTSASAGRITARTGAQDQGDAPRRRRVHAPISAPRLARRLPSHPPLRVRQRPSGDKLALCRKLLDVPAPASEADGTEPADDPSLPPCPCCGGRMIIVEQFAAAYPTVMFDSYDRGRFRQHLFNPRASIRDVARLRRPPRPCRCAMLINASTIPACRLLTAVRARSASAILQPNAAGRGRQTRPTRTIPIVLPG